MPQVGLKPLAYSWS